MSSSARRKSFQPKRQKSHQQLEINEDCLSKSILDKNFDNNDLSFIKNEKIINTESSSKFFY